METDYFVIVAGVQQGDTLAPYLFIICLNYVFSTSIDKMKDNGFKPAKERNKISRTNYYRRRLRRWQNSGKFTRPSRIPATQPGTSSRWQRPPCQRRQNRIYVLWSKRRNFHTKGWSFETSWQVHLPRKQCLINREWHQHSTSKGMDSYQ